MVGAFKRFLYVFKPMILAAKITVIVQSCRIIRCYLIDSEREWECGNKEMSYVLILDDKFPGARSSIPIVYPLWPIP